MKPPSPLYISGQGAFISNHRIELKEHLGNEQLNTDGYESLLNWKMPQLAKPLQQAALDAIGDRHPSNLDFVFLPTPF